MESGVLSFNEPRYGVLKRGKPVIGLKPKHQCAVSVNGKNWNNRAWMNQMCEIKWEATYTVAYECICTIAETFYGNIMRIIRNILKFR